MGTLSVEKNTLRAMMLEILFKDKEFLRDILQAIVKEDPNCLEEFTSISTPSSINGSHVVVQGDVMVGDQNVETKDIGEAEARKVAKNQFEKYSNVFKALA